MALFQCPECGKDVSDKAPVCPKCGYPLQQEMNETTPPLAPPLAAPPSVQQNLSSDPPNFQRIETQSNKSSPAESPFRTTYIALGLICIAVALTWFFLAPAHPDAPSSVSEDTTTNPAVAAAAAAAEAAAKAPTAVADAASAVTAVQVPADGTVKVSADEIASAYNSNEVTADQRFKGKSILVTGVLLKVIKNESNSITASLSYGAGDFVGEVAAEDISEDDAVKLKQYSSVTFLCKGNGKRQGYLPDLVDCILQ